MNGVVPYDQVVLLLCSAATAIFDSIGVTCSVIEVYCVYCTDSLAYKRQMNTLIIHTHDIISNAPLRTHPYITHSNTPLVS